MQLNLAAQVFTGAVKEGCAPCVTGDPLSSGPLPP